MLILLFSSYLLFYKGSLTFSSNVENVSIKIDDKEYKKDVRKISLRPGKHSVEISKLGYSTIRKDLDVGLFDNTKINVILSPSLNRLLDNKVVSPEISTDGNTLYYYNPENKYISRISLETLKVDKISDKINETVTKIFWSRDKTKAIVFLSSDTNEERAYYFDTSSKSLEPLDKNIGSPLVWSSDNQKIAYQYQSEVYNISISSYSGNSREVIGETGPIENLEWLGNGNLIYTFQSIDDEGEFSPSKIVDPESKEIKDLINEDVISWKVYADSNNMEQLLYQAVSENSAAIKILNTTSGEIKNTKLSINLKGSSYNPNLEELYYINEIGTDGEKKSSSTLKKISLATNKEESLELSKEVVSENLFITADKRALILENNTLYIIGVN